MKGTEKQIKWAEDIIAQVNADLDAMIKTYETFKARVPNDPTFAYGLLRYTPEQVEKVRSQANAAFAVCDAAKIIDNRRGFSRECLEKMATRA